MSSAAFEGEGQATLRLSPNLQSAEGRVILAEESTGSVKTVAIIGGGPAGAMAAERLARGGVRVTLFEEKPGWEKPCGGALTAKVLRRYSFLTAVAPEARYVREAQFAGAKGVLVTFRLRQPVAIYSRAKLNRALLGRAADAGAEIVEDRIVSLSRAGAGWRLEGRRQLCQADFVLLAAGARSRLRVSLAGDLQPRDFMLTFGYYVPGQDERLRVAFFDDFEGYAWAFPRTDHLSIGVCGRVGDSGMPELRARLQGFVNRFGYRIDGAPVYAHLLPALTAESWSNLRLAGPQWALAGDIAGLVDPVTGEGVYYAMRSGELLAESLLEGSPASYPQRIWQDFGSELVCAARLRALFYRTDFLGSPISAHMIRFSSRSQAVLGLLQDLIEGTQAYSNLPTRIYGRVAASLVEIAANSLGAKLPYPRSAES